MLEASMKANDDVHSLVGTILTEIEEIKEQLSIVAEVSEPVAAGFEFRPLTEEEKNEFIESLDDKGRQILVELAGAKGEIAR
jgi:hypothetical protein